MRSVVCEALDAPLTVVESPLPSPADDEVLIEVAAAGLNYVDALICLGRYQVKTPTPFTPGSEVAGRVAAVGASVTEHSIGDRVFGAPRFGGYASHALAGSDRVRPLPDALSFGQGATFVQSYSTMRYAYRRAGLQAGDWVLVLGAAGGVGRAAIDLAKAGGARVIAAASSEARLQQCRDAGADVTIDYTTSDLKTAARDASDGGVDIVVDPVGGVTADPALRAMGYLGRYLVIGFAGGGIPTLPLNQVLLRNRNIVGIDWGAWQTAFPDEQTGLVDELTALAGGGKIHPQEPSAYPLEAAQRALTDLLERRVVGKAILRPDAD